MENDELAPAYRIWAVDGVLYGPVDLDTLIGWVKEERVLANTWVYQEPADRWSKALEIEELAGFFLPATAKASTTKVGTELALEAISEIDAQMLRRCRLLSNLSDPQLEQFLPFVEACPIAERQIIVKQGDPAGAMFLVLNGEVRVRLMVSGKEVLLSTLRAGEFFGEVSLFDHGPRTADVVANQDSLLAKITIVSFQKLVATYPALAAPLLAAIAKTLTARIRADDKRIQDSMRSVKPAGQFFHM